MASLFEQRGEPAVIVRRQGAVGRITLNRPQALNALNLDMVRSLRAALDFWQIEPAVALVVIEGAGERAFCAGGDIRAVYESGRKKDGTAEAFWAEEYRLNAIIAHYSKPIVALMDGIVMGGGAGLSIHASHRIATETTKFAMPEVGIGFLPDVGSTFVLSRLPDEIGTYLAMTGVTIGADDVLHCGLADHLVPRAALGKLVLALEASSYGTDVAAQIQRELERHSYAPAAAPLQAKAASISALFAGGDAAAIAERLDGDPGDFGRQTKEILLSRSPTSVVLALASLRAAAHLPTLEACLDLEYRLATSLLDGEDLYAGIKAVVIDKTRTPQWSAPHVRDIPLAAFDHLFATQPET